MEIAKFISDLSITDDDLKITRQFGPKNCENCIKVQTIMRKIKEINLCKRFWFIYANRFLVDKDNNNLVLINCFVSTDCRTCRYSIYFGSAVVHLINNIYYLVAGSTITKLHHSKLPSNYQEISSDYINFVQLSEIGNAILLDYSLTSRQLIYFDCTCEKINKLFYQLSNGRYITLVDNKNEIVVLNEHAQPMSYNAIHLDTVENDLMIFKNESVEIAIRNSTLVYVKYTSGKCTKPAVRVEYEDDEATEAGISDCAI